MQGIDIEGLHPSSRSAISTVMKQLYGNLYDPGAIEDIVLFTDRRNEFPNIGTESIGAREMQYLMDNAYWINVCLYVNADFRACFNDAVTIEKALLQVNDQEYRDFRDDMTLESDDGPGAKKIPIDLGTYSEPMEMTIRSKIESARMAFYKAGMTEVYNDLSSSFDRSTASETAYIVANMIYVINAFSRNGVFRKYVTLVVDSVKRQLS